MLNKWIQLLSNMNTSILVLEAYKTAWNGSQMLVCATIIWSSALKKQLNLFTLQYLNNKEENLTLCKRRTKFSLYSWLPSIMPVKGLENHSLNSECDWNTLGMRKCINDHSSIKEFWRGVPVSSNRLWLEKFRSICHLCDLKFLIFWAWNRDALILCKIKTWKWNIITAIYTNGYV